VTADSAAVWLIAAAALPETVYFFIYTFTAPWWRSAVGRALFTKGLALTLLLDIAVLYQLFGNDYPGRDAVRLTVYTLIVVGLWLQLGAYLHVKHQAAKQGGE